MIRSTVIQELAEHSGCCGFRVMACNPHIGSSLDDLLEAIGDLDEVRNAAINRVAQWFIHEQKLVGTQAKATRRVLKKDGDF